MIEWVWKKQDFEKTEQMGDELKKFYLQNNYFITEYNRVEIKFKKSKLQLH